MKWKSLDLRKASIFDLTDDPEIIKQFWEPDFLCPTKEHCIKQSKEAGSVSPANPLQIEMLLSYAQLTSDNDFKVLVYKTFEAELLNFGFE